jgi:hypothetical protein
MSERRPRKSGDYKKKIERAMVARGRDINLSSSYTSSCSNGEEEEVDRHKSEQSSKNINGLCYNAQGFCGMAHNSGSKKSQKDD